MKLITIVLASLSVAHYSSAQTTDGHLDDSDVCKGKEDGTYVIDPKDKHIYYECNGGLAGKFHCPSNLIFDTKLNACAFDPDAPTQAPPDGPGKYNCHNKQDGFYADEKSETLYHQCYHGMAFDFSCPPNTIFDAAKSVCVFDNNNGPTPTAAPLSTATAAPSITPTAEPASTATAAPSFTATAEPTFLPTSPASV